MKCPRCGYRESDESEFCSRCGKLLKAPEGDEAEKVLRQIEEEEDESKAKARKSRQVRKVGILAGAAVVVVVAAFVGYTIAQGPPAQIVGNWSSSTYGGLLALLTPGTRVQIQSETGGHLAGTVQISSTAETIVQSAVSGHHVSLTAKKAGYGIYYTFSGTVSSDDKSITGVITEHNTNASPPTTKQNQVTLHKV